MPPDLNRISKTEWFTVALGLICFLILTTIIQGRFLPWNDEVQFTEPAANLYYHMGFVSRAESTQTDRVFWATNAPIYPALLYVGFRTFNFSLTVARSLNSAIMALAALCLWASVIRARLLLRQRSRLLLLLFILTGSSCYVCYLNLRYDGLSFLECSLGFLAYTITSRTLRNTCLLVIGTIMVLTNPQLPAYVALLVVILTVSYSLGFTLLWRLLFLYLGLAVGIATLLLLYKSQSGALAAFLTTINQQVNLSLQTKLADLNYYFQYDASLISVVVFLIAIFAFFRFNSDQDVRRSSVAGILICIVLPLFFFCARRFVFSLAWTAYIPAVICVCRILEAELRLSRQWKVFTVICCAVSMGYGLPRALVGIVNEWKLRDYAAVEAFVKANVETQDTVFCDSAAYFAAKPRAVRVYGPGYLDVINSEEKNSITILVVTPMTEASVVKQLGGKWITVRSFVRDSASSTDKLLPFNTHFTGSLNVLRRASGL